VDSYFPPFLPRRRTMLLSNASLDTVQISPSTYHSSSTELDGDVEDLHGILAMPPSSSVTRLSSIPPPSGHQAHSPANLDQHMLVLLNPLPYPLSPLRLGETFEVDSG
jgi:hypothetical protein